MTELPDVVKVGTYRYTIELTSPGIGIDGDVQHRKARIRISPKQAEDPRRDSLLHEILHAICWQSGLRSVLGLEHDDEEKVIRLLTPSLLAVLQNNPDVVAYLTNQ